MGMSRQSVWRRSSRNTSSTKCTCLPFCGACRRPASAPQSWASPPTTGQSPVRLARYIPPRNARVSVGLQASSKAQKLCFPWLVGFHCSLLGRCGVSHKTSKWLKTSQHHILKPSACSDTEEPNLTCFGRECSFSTHESSSEKAARCPPATSTTGSLRAAILSITSGSAFLQVRPLLQLATNL